MPDPVDQNPKGRGGTHFHNPACQCNPCKARHRSEEALTVSAGDGGSALASQQTGEETIDADIVVPPLWRHRGKLGSRAIIADWLRLRALEPNITIKDASIRLGMHRATLSAIINRGAREGWLRFDDPLSRIEHQIVPKVLDNLNHFLDEKDKTVTIETAKGTVFKAYQNEKGITDAPVTMLALKIEMPPGEDDPKVIVGRVAGKPKILVTEGS